MSSYKDRYTFDERRQSGRSTMLALNFVHLILDNPDTWIAIEDHGPTMECDRYLFDLVCCVLRSLRVQFETHKPRLQIRSSGALQTYLYPTADEIREEDSRNNPYSLSNKRNNLF